MCGQEEARLAWVAAENRTDSFRITMEDPQPGLLTAAFEWAPCSHPSTLWHPLCM